MKKSKIQNVSKKDVKDIVNTPRTICKSDFRKLAEWREESRHSKIRI